jgi:hypothetical protein
LANIFCHKMAIPLLFTLYSVFKVRNVGLGLDFRDSNRTTVDGP